MGFNVGTDDTRYLRYWVVVIIKHRKDTSYVISENRQKTNYVTKWNIVHAFDLYVPINTMSKKFTYRSAVRVRVQKMHLLFWLKLLRIP